jgi:hypothetical protein
MLQVYVRQEVRGQEAVYSVKYLKHSGGDVSVALQTRSLARTPKCSCLQGEDAWDNVK